MIDHKGTGNATLTYMQTCTNIKLIITTIIMVLIVNRRRNGNLRNDIFSGVVGVANTFQHL